MTTHNLRAYRMALADADRNLRNARDTHETIKAQAEQAAIGSGVAGGKNAEERERSLIIALNNDDRYQNSLAMLRDAEWSRDRAEQLLEAAKDERRAAEWQIRCRLADALFSRGVQSDSDDAAGDTAFDDATDEATYRLAAGLLPYVQVDDDDFPF